MPDSVDVNESINIDSSPAAPDASPAAAGQDGKSVLNYIRDARKAGATAARRTPRTEKTQPDMRTDDDAGTPLYGRIQGISGKPLNKTEIGRLTKGRVVVWRENDGNAPAVTDLYAISEQFQQYVEATFTRIKQIADANSEKLKNEQLIGLMRNFHRESDQLPGWFQWCEKNPVTVTASAAPAFY